MLDPIRHKITLLGPMSHGAMGQDTGNVMLFRRIPRVTNGEVVQVPALSAGALRGVVRRALWREAFAACDLSRETFAAGNYMGSWDRLYAALANGGTIEAAETRVDPDRIRSRRAEMPILSLLGSALYSSHMAGRARVSNSWLVCRESGVDGARSAWDYIAEESRVRHVDSEEQDSSTSGVGPMPTTIETIVAGAELTGHAHVTGDVERSAWAHGLDLITHLGGKAGQGFGEVAIQHDGDGSQYVEWLRDNATELRSSLLRLAEELGGSATSKKKGKAKAAPATAASKVSADVSGLF